MDRYGFDAIVIGAGIAGISASYWLKKGGMKVLLVDKKGLLSGASGAAGAFLAPRIGKGGELQQITDEAYEFALNFYAKNSPESFFQKGLIRLPEDEADIKNFDIYKYHMKYFKEITNPQDYGFVNPKHLYPNSLYFPKSAFVDPLGVAKELTKDLQTVWGVDAKVKRKNDEWYVKKYHAKCLVMATGADRLPVDIPYINIDGVWGERVDVRSSANIPISLHQGISVSANMDGIVRIGATHVRNDESSEIERVNKLIMDAIDIVPALKDQQIVRIYAGHRSSVNDHFPIMGAAADIEAIANDMQFPIPKKMKTTKITKRIPECYFIGGFGGRGFVFAPWMGHALAKNILNAEPIPTSVNADRYILRYLRKNWKNLS